MIKTKFTGLLIKIIGFEEYFLFLLLINGKKTKAYTRNTDLVWGNFSNLNDNRDLLVHIEGLTVTFRCKTNIKSALPMFFCTY